MPLDELLKTIEVLRERAQRHRAILSASEAQTRYSLIDPLLRALGWDTEDPAQVRVEDPTGAGKADYSLLLPTGETHETHVYVEAKRLGHSLDEGLAQGITYCVSKGTPYFAVTDGMIWKIYDAYKRAPMEEKMVTEWDIAKEDTWEVARKALALWRPNLKRMPAQSPVVPLSTAVVSQPLSAAPSPAPSPAPGGVPLSQSLSLPPELRPKKVRFPDGKEVKATSWRAVLIETARWLHEQGKLPPQVPWGRYYIVNREPLHPTGKPFGKQEPIGPVYLESDVSGEEAKEWTVTLVKEAGLDPSQILVFTKGTP